MLDRIQKVLYSKFQDDQLAHFYLIEPTISDSNNKLLDWTTELVLEMNELYSKKIENQADVMILSSDVSAKQYTLEQINEIFSFTTYRPLSLKKKFLIIPEAHKLTKIHANKLLKTFEEPPVDLIILLINPQKVKMLDTITSRSIKLRISVESTIETNNIQQIFDESQDLQAFSLKLAALKQSSQVLYRELLDIVNSSSIKTKPQWSTIKNDLDGIIRDVIYNGSWQNKAFKIYSVVKSLK